MAAALLSASGKLKRYALMFDEAAQKGDSMQCRTILTSIQSLSTTIGFQLWLSLPVWNVVLGFLTLREVGTCETTCQTMNKWIRGEQLKAVFTALYSRVQRIRAETEAEADLAYMTPPHWDASRNERDVHTRKRKQMLQHSVQKKLTSSKQQSLPCLWDQMKKSCRCYNRGTRQLLLSCCSQ